MIHTIVLDEGWTTTAQAEHGALDRVARLGLQVVLACTHFLPAAGGRPPRVVVTAEPAGLPEPGTGPALAPAGPELDRVRAAHLTGRSGRAFVFPGLAQLDRIVTVATLLTGSAVDDVVILGAAIASAEDRIDTQNHLRPEFSAGRLVLRTRPSIGGHLVPFEQPNPTPCCADHG